MYISLIGSNHILEVYMQNLIRRQEMAPNSHNDKMSFGEFPFNKV